MWPELLHNERCGKLRCDVNVVWNCCDECCICNVLCDVRCGKLNAICCDVRYGQCNAMHWNMVWCEIYGVV